VNPSAFIEGATGVVAIVMIFGVPIVAIIAALAIVMSVVNRRHKERMKMIEQGMIPPPPRKQKGNYYGLMITGAIFSAFGLALVAGELASRGNDFKGGFMFAFIGLAMIACFAVIRRARKNETDDKPDYGKPAPPPLPPQP
jgi:hypothetical protein